MQNWLDVSSKDRYFMLCTRILNVTKLYLTDRDFMYKVPNRKGHLY